MLPKQPAADPLGHDAPYDSGQGSNTVEMTAESSVDPASLTEGAFLTYILDQLHSGQRTPSVRLSDADLAAIEAEPIGDYFSRYPFLY